MTIPAFRSLSLTLRPTNSSGYSLPRFISIYNETQKMPVCHKSTMVLKDEGTEHNNSKRDEKLCTVSIENARPLSSMPGPGGFKRLPYMGTVFLFHPFSKYTPETFGRMACDMHDKYGPVFKTRLGMNYSVHTCNVEDIDRIFSQESPYPRRRLMDLSRVYRERCGLPQGLGSCEGPEWHALRKPLNVALKRPKAVLCYMPSLNVVADEFVQRLQDVEGEEGPEKAEEMYKLFFKFSSEGIGVACFNERLGFLSRDLDNCPEKKKLLEYFRTSIRCTFRAIIGLERRYLKSDKDKFYLLYRDTMNYIREQSLVYVNKVLPSATASSQTSGLHDMVNDGDESNLLTTLVRRKELSMGQILSIIDSLLIAGSDSTAKILSVLLYDIATHTEIQERVADEVRKHAGPNGPITGECLDELRLVKACVKESMRVHYPVSSGIERIMTRDMVLSGYHVSAGTSVFMTGVRTSRDPIYFPDPTSFKPDRWLRQLRKQTTPDDNPTTEVTGSQANNNPRLSALAFVPFGVGSRSCVGSRFAEIELFLGLAKIVQSLRVSVHPSFKGLRVNYTPFITPLEPIPFIFTKR